MPARFRVGVWVSGSRCVGVRPTAGARVEHQYSVAVPGGSCRWPSTTRRLPLWGVVGVERAWWGWPGVVLTRCWVLRDRTTPGPPLWGLGVFGPSGRAGTLGAAVPVHQLVGVWRERLPGVGLVVC